MGVLGCFNVLVRFRGNILCINIASFVSRLGALFPLLSLYQHHVCIWHTVQEGFRDLGSREALVCCSILVCFSFFFCLRDDFKGALGWRLMLTLERDMKVQCFPLYDFDAVLEVYEAVWRGVWIASFGSMCVCTRVGSEKDKSQLVQGTG